MTPERARSAERTKSAERNNTTNKPMKQTKKTERESMPPPDVCDDAVQESQSEDLELLKLTRDLKKTAESMTCNQARVLIKNYYSMQKRRMREALQIGQLVKKDEPHETLDYFKQTSQRHEREAASVIAAWAAVDPMAQWSMETVGVGPIIAACLSSFINIEMCPTVGHIWRFSGLDPTCKWGKGEKRPFCAALKVACWKLGESFVKVSKNPDDVYGKVYLQRKAYETQKNEAGDYAAQAAEGVARVGKTTEAYKHYSNGKLPPGHIHSRAKRYAVKLFLSHWHAEAYRRRFGEEPPLPYPIAYLNHAHAI